MIDKWATSGKIAYFSHRVDLLPYLKLVMGIWQRLIIRHVGLIFCSGRRCMKVSWLNSTLWPRKKISFGWWRPKLLSVNIKSFHFIVHFHIFQLFLYLIYWINKINRLFAFFVDGTHFNIFRVLYQWAVSRICVQRLEFWWFWLQIILKLISHHL